MLGVFIIAVFLALAAASYYLWRLPQVRQKLKKTIVDNKKEIAAVGLSATLGTAGATGYYFARRLGGGGNGGDGWLSGWNYRVQIDIDCGDVDSTLSSFPVLIHLSNGDSGIYDEDVSFIFDEIGSNSKKIALTVGEDTETFVEIERWDSGSEEAWLWANVTATSSTNQTLYLYYDNDHADNTAHVDDSGTGSSVNVWDDNYVAVYHLKDATSTSVYDSTSYDNDGTKSGTNEPAQGSGKIDYGQDFEETTTDKIEHAADTELKCTEVTLESWVKIESVSANTYGVVGRWNTGSQRSYALGMAAAEQMTFWASKDGGWNAGSRLRVYHTSTMSTDTWYHYVATYDNDGTAALYLAGSDVGTETDSMTGDIHAGTCPLQLGCEKVAGTDDRWMDGVLDEVRVSDISRSSAWIKADHESQIDDLLDYGGQEVAKPTLNSPSDDSYVCTWNVDFKYTPPDVEILNCSLWLNLSGTWGREAWNASTIQGGVENTISFDFTSEGEDTYLWNIQMYKTGDMSVFADSNWTVKIESASPYIFTFHASTSDGDVQATGGTYATVNSAASGTVHDTDDYVRIGNRKAIIYYINRAFVFFDDTSQIPNNFAVISANISLYRYDIYITNPNPDFNITIQNGQSTYPHDPLQTTDYDRTHYSGSGGLFDTANWAAGWNLITLNTVGQGWINQTGTTKLCLRTSRDISQTEPTLSTEYVDFVSAENGTYIPKLTVEGKSDPQRSTSINALRDPFQRKVFYAKSRMWEYFYDGENCGFISTADGGVSYTEFTAIGPPYSLMGESFAIFYDPVHDYVDYILCNDTYSTLYRRGVPQADGNISYLTNEQVVHSGAPGNFLSMPYVGIDTNGYPWFGVQNGSSEGYQGQAMKGQFTNGTWKTQIRKNVTSVGTILDAPRVVIVKLSEGTIGVLSATRGNQIKYYYWNTTDWEIEDETATTSNTEHGDFMCAVSVLSTVHLAFLKDSTYDVTYTRRNTTAWETETTLISGATSTTGVQLTWDKSTDDLIVAWANLTDNYFYKRIRYANEMWGTSAQWFEATYSISNERTCHFGYENYGTIIPFVYQTTIGTVYKVCVYNITIEGTILETGWNELTALSTDVGHTLGEVNASLKSDAINWTVILVDYQNGTIWELIWDQQLGEYFGDATKIVVSTSDLIVIYCLESGVWLHGYS